MTAMEATAIMETVIGGRRSRGSAATTTRIVIPNARCAGLTRAPRVRKLLQPQPEVCETAERPAQPHGVGSIISEGSCPARVRIGHEHHQRLWRISTVNLRGLFRDFVNVHPRLEQFPHPRRARRRAPSVRNDNGCGDEGIIEYHLPPTKYQLPNAPNARPNRPKLYNSGQET